MNHDLIRKLREEIRVLRDRGGFLTPIEEIGLMRLCGFLALNNVWEGASIVRWILERNRTKPVPMMSPMPLPPGTEVPNG